MCLYIKMNKPAIAQKDIIVYKWLDKRNNQLYPPFFSNKMIYKLDKEYHTLLYERLGEVNAGFHSIKNRIEAITHVAKCKCNNKPCLCKCIIPKGSKYYQGKDCADIKGYASNKIIVKRKLIFNLF